LFGGYESEPTTTTSTTTTTVAPIVTTTTTTTTTTTLPPPTTTTTTTTTTTLAADHPPLVAFYSEPTTTTTTTTVRMADTGIMYYYEPQGVTESRPADNENGPYIPQYTQPKGRMYSEETAPDITPSGEMAAETDKKDNSTFIRFKDSGKDLPMGDKYDYEAEDNSDKLYRSSTFIPKNEEEFDKAKPKYRLSAKKIVLSGDHQISNTLAAQMFNRSVEQFRKNDFTNAETAFKKLIHYNSYLSDSYYYLSQIANLRKEYLPSIDYMKLAMSNSDKSSENSKYLYHIGSVYYTMGSYNTAVEYFTDALSNTKDGVYMYNSLGMCYYKLGDYKNAIRYWKAGMNKGDKECKKSYQWLMTKVKDDKK
jgi:tetratricopeptide (TPR) repeat protein